MDTKEDSIKKRKKKRSLMKKNNRIWMRLLVFFPKHASGFRSPFTAYLAISSYADPENFSMDS